MLDRYSLRNLRERNNISQSQLANVMGCTRCYISEYETGKRNYSQEKHDEIVKGIYTIVTRRNEEKRNIEKGTQE